MSNTDCGPPEMSGNPTDVERRNAEPPRGKKRKSLRCINFRRDKGAVRDLLSEP